MQKKEVSKQSVWIILNLPAWHGILNFYYKYILEWEDEAQNACFGLHFVNRNCSLVLWGSSSSRITSVFFHWMILSHRNSCACSAPMRKTPVFCLVPVSGITVRNLFWNLPRSACLFSLPHTPQYLERTLQCVFQILAHPGCWNLPFLVQRWTSQKWLILLRYTVCIVLKKGTDGVFIKEITVCSD